MYVLFMYILTWGNLIPGFALFNYKNGALLQVDTHKTSTFPHCEIEWHFIFENQILAPSILLLFPFLNG